MADADYEYKNLVIDNVVFNDAICLRAYNYLT